MKTLFLFLALFALGCYPQQPVQYVPAPAQAPAPAPTIIEVPKDQPQPARPIIITPWGERHRDFRHGQNDTTPATKPGAQSGRPPFLHFTNLETATELPPETATAPPAVYYQPANLQAEPGQPASVAPAPSAHRGKRLGPALRQRLHERPAARLHRADR